MMHLRRQLPSRQGVKADNMILRWEILQADMKLRSQKIVWIPAPYTWGHSRG